MNIDIDTWVKRNLGLPSEDLVNVFTEFLEEDDPETPEEIDAALREAGYDPQEIGTRMQATAEQALANSLLNWRRRSQEERPEPTPQDFLALADAVLDADQA